MNLIWKNSKKLENRVRLLFSKQRLHDIFKIVFFQDLSAGARRMNWILGGKTILQQPPAPLVLITETTLWRMLDSEEWTDGKFTKPTYQKKNPRNEDSI